MAAESCGVCRFHQAGSNACRRYPPSVSVFPVARDEKGNVEFTAQSAFPTTQAEHGWCGEWEPAKRIIQ